MFVLCQLEGSNLGPFILFSITPFELEDPKLQKLEDLKFDHEKFTFENPKYDEYPILNYLDFQIRTFNGRARTVTHVLSEEHIETVNQIFREYNKILDKKSKLSVSKRQFLFVQYNRLKHEEDNTPISTVHSMPVNESTGE